MTIEETIEKTKRNILDYNQGSKIRTIIVTSSARSEGSTTIAVNLAKSFAKEKNGITLLIDGNVRHPKAASLLDLDVSKDSLHDINPVPTQIPNLFFKVKGSNGSDSSLNPDAFIPDLESFRNDYKFIIIDSPAVNEFHDSQNLYKIVDGIVLVVHASKTRYEVVLEAKRQILSCGGKVLGVILNKRNFHIPGFIYKLL